MSNYQFEIPAAPLKAALLCTAHKDVRFYLQGVAIDKGHIVSTDGHRMFYCEVTNLDDNLPSIIIPKESIEFLFKNTRSLDLTKYNVLVTHETKQCNLQILGTPHSQTFQLIDARYPDWKRTIPKTEATVFNKKQICFNWDYMADYQKIAKIIGVKKELNPVTLTTVQEQPPMAFVDFINISGENYKARGVLMGIKTD